MIRKYFATPIYYKKLSGLKGLSTLNRSLAEDCAVIEREDKAGVSWSKKNYQSGYTSYSSFNNLHEMHSQIKDLMALIDQEVFRFALSMEWDLKAHRPRLTHCWINRMSKGCYHSWHIHPLSVISGTYYVSCPKGSPPIKFEDPRSAFKMATPALRGKAKNSDNLPYIELPARAGHLVLFESWLPHEVPMHMAQKPRISLSFNYA